MTNSINAVGTFIIKLTCNFPRQMASINLRPLPWNGNIPDNKTWRRTPAAQMSTALPYCRLSTTSGAIKLVQPTLPVGHSNVICYPNAIIIISNVGDMNKVDGAPFLIIWDVQADIVKCKISLYVFIYTDRPCIL